MSDKTIKTTVRVRATEIDSKLEQILAAMQNAGVSQDRLIVHDMPDGEESMHENNCECRCEPIPDRAKASLVVWHHNTLATISKDEQ